MKELQRTAIFTDIHWGRKQNSEQHNKDCWDFIQWFIEQVKQDPTIDSIAFLGDWFENRNTLNIATAQVAFQGAKALNGVGKPVYFVPGNHDLYYRHSRDITSVASYEMFPNFHFMAEPTLIPNMGSGTMFAPYMFEHEYPAMYEKFHDTKVWMGHFEFRGFIVTGYGVQMPTGPDHTRLTGIDAILCGHFHKRQIKDNVVYIGNAFPMDFGDVDDPDRGMTVFNHGSNTFEFTKWPDQPLFSKIKISKLLEMDNYGSLMLDKHRIKCIVDIPISYEESMELKRHFTSELHGVDIREFTLEESSTLKQALTETQTAVVNEEEDINVSRMIVEMLREIKADSIDNELLVSIYQSVHGDEK